MSRVQFLKAGKHPSNERVFFTTNSRQAAKGTTVFHRNRYSSIWSIPRDFFRAHFTYCPQSGIYRNVLTYADIEQFLVDVIDHEPYREEN